MPSYRVVARNDPCHSYGCAGVGFLVFSMAPLAIYKFGQLTNISWIFLIWGLLFGFIGIALLLMATCKFLNPKNSSIEIVGEDGAILQQPSAESTRQTTAPAAMPAPRSSPMNPIRIHHRRNSPENRAPIRTLSRSPTRETPGSPVNHSVPSVEENSSPYDPPSYHDQVTLPIETGGSSSSGGLPPSRAPDGHSDAPPSYQDQVPDGSPPPPSYTDVLRGGYLNISPGHSLYNITEDQETNTEQ